MIEAFSTDFMRHALYAGLLVGAGCAYLGVFVVLRRIVFLGVTLTSLSSAGVALALLTNLSPMIGSLAFMAVGVIFFSLPLATRRLSSESLIGLGYAVATAAGILLIAKSPKGEAHMLDLLFGDILTVQMGQIIELAVVLAVVLLIQGSLFKEFLFTSFDHETAEAMGYRISRWNLFFYLTLGIAIAFAIRSVGVLLTFSSLVIPAVTALLITTRFRLVLILSVLLGMIPVPIGLYLSLSKDLPSSAAIVAVSACFFVIAMIVHALRRQS